MRIVFFDRIWTVIGVRGRVVSVSTKAPITLADGTEITIVEELEIQEAGANLPYRIRRPIMGQRDDLARLQCGSEVDLLFTTGKWFGRYAIPGLILQGDIEGIPFNRTKDGATILKNYNTLNSLRPLANPNSYLVLIALLMQLPSLLQYHQRAEDIPILFGHAAATMLLIIMALYFSYWQPKQTLLKMLRKYNKNIT